MTFSSIRQTWYSRLISLCLMVTFVVSMVITPRVSYAQEGVLGLPQPGTMVNLSTAYVPSMITGLTVHPENPLMLDFIVSTGNSGMNANQVKKESDRLIKYFLACLTIPENDQWVNLSPYEKERIVPEDLGQTVLGQDMLAQDYILKQLTASLIYPERNLGKNFWDKVYSKARQMYGTTQIPVNTFNKVWILPEYAKVYEHKNTVLVVKSHLKVMLDEDYLALSKHANVNASSVNNLGSQIVRQIILPAIEQEVNTGKNFAQLRQIYNSMILAVWFKNNLKQALLNQVYTDKAKVNGVNVDDPSIKEKIYKQYLQAYKKGVFNYIKEETDQSSQEVIPRKYFSGGLTPFKIGEIFPVTRFAAGTYVRDWSINNVNYLVNILTRGANRAAGLAIGANNSAMLGQMPHHLSEAELRLLREPDETDGFISKRPFDENRVRGQVLAIEQALGNSEDNARAKADEVIAWVKEKASNFKNEEAHILNGTGPDAKVIGRVDRKIAEKLGYAHETANIVLLSPDGEVILQMRNKDSYDDHLSMYGGHLEVGESHAHGALTEASQESGIDNFERPMIFMGMESYDKPGDNNRERRSWFVQVLTPQEWAKIKQEKADEERQVGADRNTDDRPTFKSKLRSLWSQGKGEVTALYAFTFDQIAEASQKPNPQSKLEDKNNRFLLVNDTFQGQTTTTEAFFTPDSLDTLVKNTQLWAKIRNLTPTLSPTQKNYEGQYMYHAVPKAYLDQQREGGIYTPERFWADGFIHFSADIPTALKMANRFYSKGTDEIVLLKVDAQQARSSGKLVIDDNKDAYPHLYGQMNLGAVTGEAVLVRNASGQLELASGNPAMTAAEIRQQFGTRLDDIIGHGEYQQAVHFRAVADALMKFSDDFNYIQLDGTPEAQKAFNDILVKKSKFARDIAVDWVNNNGKDSPRYNEYVSDILEKGLASIDAFGQKMIASGAAKKSSIESAIKLTKQLLPEWLDAKNNVPQFIIAGMIRGLLEGRSEDILYCFGKDWRMFGTAGIRNQAVQSSFGAIADLELEEFAQGPHATILTGPNLMNVMTIIQQQQAIVNVYHEVQKAARENTIDALIKEKQLDPRFVEDIVNNNKISIAYDSRINGKYFAHMLAAGFLNEGIDVDLFDRPSGVPAVVYQAAEDPKKRSAMGILMSASHSEANYNGFKAFLSVYRSQVDTAGKNMVVGQRPAIVGEPAKGIAVVPYKMHSELGAMNLEDFNRIFEEHAAVPAGTGRLKWISDEQFNPTTNQMGADVDNQFFVRYYKHIQELSPAELLGLFPDERSAFEAAKKDMKIFYTAFSGGGAVNAQNFPGFLKRMGYEQVSINENQTLKHDGRFAGFNRPGGLFGMPDPGVAQGWLVNFVEFLQQEAGNNLDEDKLSSAIEKMNSFMVGLATDPDIDRGGILLTLEKGMEGGNIKAPLIKTVEEKLTSMGLPADHIARVKELLTSRLNDSLLLTANDAWTFIVYHKLRMMIERGKMSKDKLYIIEKSHVTTDALSFVAEYFRNQGYHVYTVDTYVGFTELAKKSRDLFKIAQISWMIHQHLKTGEVDLHGDSLRKLYSDLEQLNAELKRNVMFQRQGVPLIDETIKKLGGFLNGQGSIQDVMSALSIVAHMEIPMGVEESNGYGEFGAFVPNEDFYPAINDTNWENEQIGHHEKEHISEKDGSLAAYEFAELLALGKSLENKNPFQMYLDVFKAIGAVGTDNRFINYVGLTGEDKKLGAMEWFEKTLAVILKQAVDTGKEITLFNGKYKVKDVQVYRDAKYDVFGIGFPEEGVRLVLERIEDGSELFVTYRPSGTGANNRTYSWVFGAKNYKGKDISAMDYQELNAYRVNIVGALNELAKDFFGIQDQTTGYAKLEKKDFYGLMSALGEVPFEQYDNFLGKVIDQPELIRGFTSPEEIALRANAEEFGKALRPFTNPKTGVVNTQNEEFQSLRQRNTELWENLMSQRQALEYPVDKRIYIYINGKTVEDVPDAYAQGWQTSMVDYLAQLIKQKADTGEPIKVSSNSKEVLTLIARRYGKELENVNFGDAAMRAAKVDDLRREVDEYSEGLTPESRSATNRTFVAGHANVYMAEDQAFKAPVKPLKRKRSLGSLRTSPIKLSTNRNSPANGGIDLNSRNLNMESEGEKVNITFNAAMIAQFRRGDFSGVKIQILGVVPVNLMPLLGLKEDEEPGQLAKA